MRRSHIALGVIVGVSLLLAAVHTASAKAKKTLDYRYGSIWSTAIRLLRVDRGYKITEKNRRDGYMLFVFPGTGSVKRCAASLEIYSVTDGAGFIRNRVQLKIAHQPSYIELHLLDRLESKLRAERGTPPPPRRARKPKDKDKDKGKGGKGKDGKDGKGGNGQRNGGGRRR